MQRAIGAINWVLMLATLASAVALYAIKHDTRRLEVRVLAQERALERAENDVTVLTAERAHLARPARLEVLARAIGIVPHRRRPIPAPRHGRRTGSTEVMTSAYAPCGRWPPSPSRRSRLRSRRREGSGWGTHKGTSRGMNVASLPRRANQLTPGLHPTPTSRQGEGNRVRWTVARSIMHAQTIVQVGWPP